MKIIKNMYIIFIFGIIAGVVIGHNVGQRVTGEFNAGVFYAQAYYKNKSGVTMDFVAGEYYNLTFSNYDLKGFTCSDNENLTCNVAGIYLTNYYAVGSGQNNHDYVLVVRVNGVHKLATSIRKKAAAGGDIMTMSGTGIITLSSGDKVTLSVRDYEDSGEGTYYGSDINLVRISS